MRIEKISTQRFFLKYTLMIIFLCVFACLYFLFMPDQEGNIYTDKYDLSNSWQVTGKVSVWFSAMLFIISTSLLKTKRGKWLLIDSNIKEIKTSEKYYIKSIDLIKISLNPSDIKPSLNRSITYGGGNNWIEFKYNHKRIKFEFLLEGREKEEEFLSLVEEWKKVTNVTIGKAPKAFFDYFEW